MLGGMRFDRRGFLRALCGALALATRPARASRPAPGALDVHRDTRNTPRGAFGVRLPRLSSPPPVSKPYPAEPRLPLGNGDGPFDFFDSSPAGTEGGTEGSVPELTVAEVSRLLHLANGVTGKLEAGGASVMLRAAPSAGALYAGEVYLAAERVAGLAPGVYYFDVLRHALVRVRAGSARRELSAALADVRSAGDAPACVLLTNVFGRYTWRYANRGYRYALIDTGHIGENLRLAALGAGVGEALSLRFDDARLAALLGIDGRDEAVCAVHVLGRRPASRSGPASSALVEVSRAGAGARTEWERYHEATRLAPGQPPAARPVPAGEPAGGPGEPVALPAAPPAARSLAGAIRVRRSALVFREEPVAGSDFAAALRAIRGDPGLERAPGVDVLLVVHRVEGLAPGLYRLETGAARLVRLRQGDLREALVDACAGQEKAGSAAVGFALVGRIAWAAARAGERSYRDLLIESGAVAQRVYLAAEAAGLAARNLAAFYDEALNRLLHLDGRGTAVLHLTMLGPGD
jgi:SagB-type dehydrogenase family enzyme